jgi:hypothetical protein
MEATIFVAQSQAKEQADPSTAASNEKSSALLNAEESLSVSRFPLLD